MLCLPFGLHAECSDAGICRLGSPVLDHGESSRVPRLSSGLTLSLAAGSVDSGVTYTTLTPNLALHPYPELRLALALPFVRLSGDRGDANGLGDALLTAEQRVAHGSWGQVSIQAGARLDTGDDNANPGLAQAYQRGLGGTDLLLGLAWHRDAWSAALGYAIAAGANGLEGTELERGDDLALSLGYAYPFHDAWALGGRVIAVNRLDESTVSDGGGGRIRVADSDGLQINVRGGIGYAATEQLRLDAGVALPVLSRDSDVDGLTRRFAIDLGLLWTW
jgi:hypothetical protein